MTRPGTDWMDQAACADVDPDLFYHDHPTQTGTRNPFTAARAICGQCPVSRECLSYAIATESSAPRTAGHTARAGVWGGYSARERERIARNRRAD